MLTKMPLIILSILLLCSCEKTLTINEDGKVKEMKIESDDLISENHHITKYEDKNITTENESCSKYDFCHKCGLNWEGEFECGFEFSHSCPGNHEVTYEVQDYHYYTEYKIKKNRGIASVKSPMKKNQNRNHISSTQCH